MLQLGVNGTQAESRGYNYQLKIKLEADYCQLPVIVLNISNTADEAA